MDLAKCNKRSIAVFVTVAIGMFAITVPAQRGLVGKWKLTSYSFPGKRAFSIRRMNVNLSVRPTMQIDGNAGCNNYSSKLTTQPGSRIKVGPITSTDMACDDDRGSFEVLFLQILGNAGKYALKKDSLTIRDDSTKGVLRFVRLSRKP